MNDITIDETDGQRIARILLWRTRQALQDAPELMAHMRDLIPTPERGEFDVHMWAPMRLTPTDEADEFYAAMIDWVIEWAQRLNTTPPAAAAVAWSTRTEVKGFRPGTTPQGALVLTRLQTGWLRDHLDDIAQLEGAVEFFTAIVVAIGAIRGRFPTATTRPRPISGRPCPLCKHEAVGVDWLGYDDITYLQIRCEHCWWEDDNPSPAHLLRWLKKFVDVPRPLSEDCEVGNHARRDDDGNRLGCESLTCECTCHDWAAPEVGHGQQVPVVNTGSPSRLPPSTAAPDPRVCPICNLYHPEGACQ